MGEKRMLNVDGGVYLVRVMGDATGVVNGVRPLLS
jgi:hypothetical protein